MIRKVISKVPSKSPHYKLSSLSAGREVHLAILSTLKDSSTGQALGMSPSTLPSYEQKKAVLERKSYRR